MTARKNCTLITACLALRLGVVTHGTARDLTGRVAKSPLALIVSCMLPIPDIVWGFEGAAALRAGRWHNRAHTIGESENAGAAPHRKNQEGRYGTAA